jgi:hypothetical protein
VEVEHLFAVDTHPVPLGRAHRRVEEDAIGVAAVRIAVEVEGEHEGVEEEEEEDLVVAVVECNVQQAVTYIILRNNHAVTRLFRSSVWPLWAAFHVLSQKRSAADSTFVLLGCLVLFVGFLLAVPEAKMSTTWICTMASI